MFPTLRTKLVVVSCLIFTGNRFWVESENRFVRLRVTSKGMRIIDKKGIDAVLADVRANGIKV